MSAPESPLDWTPEEVSAALVAYQEAPDTATVGELRELMDCARKRVRPAPEVTSWTRDDLIGLCRDGVLPQEKWSNRDTARAQMQLGQALALLSAGCDFTARLGHRRLTIDLRVEYRGFQWFEGGLDYDDRDMYLDHEDFYVPTRARLTAVDGSDWYC